MPDVGDCVGRCMGNSRTVGDAKAHAKLYLPKRCKDDGTTKGLHGSMENVQQGAGREPVMMESARLERTHPILAAVPERHAWTCAARQSHKDGHPPPPPNRSDRNAAVFATNPIVACLLLMGWAEAARV